MDQIYNNEDTNTVDVAEEADLQVITSESVQKATEILQKYKAGKSNLEKKIVENEQFWKMRHWATMRGKDSAYTPATAWLWNVIVSKHADAMDSIPEPNILPREESDKPEAKILTSIIPVILKQNNFERVYDDTQWYKLKQGTGVYGVYWDSSKHNGLGDIAIRKVDILSCFWQPGITDIQKSRHFFTVDLIDNELLESQYPQLKDKLKGSVLTLTKYRYDDTVDITGKSAVIDWYYKKYENGKQVLHYCKYVNDVVLFATENDRENYPEGWYRHGKYPFVFDVLFPIEGSPCGYSYTDIEKDTQIQIDELSDSVTKNALMAAKKRYFINGTGSVNEEEFADWNKSFVHVSSMANIGENIQEIGISNLSGTYITVLESKINELKETSGNRDVSNGSTTASVTAASAIAALQEAAGKTSRDFIKTTYNAYEELVTQVIELIRQFYDVARKFRIVGERGMEEFVSYKNTNLKGVAQGQDGNLFGTDVAYRVPEFDIDVVAQKQTAYNKMSQNELALQFFNLGFFNPQMADQVLSCLDMMEFARKDFVTQKIMENQTMMQQLQYFMQVAFTLAQAYNPQLADQLAMQIQQSTMGAAVPSRQSVGDLIGLDALGGYKAEENSRVANARAQSRQATQI